jgi:dienelactone hydrolase
MQPGLPTPATAPPFGGAVDLQIVRFLLPPARDPQLSDGTGTIGGGRPLRPETALVGAYYRPPLNRSYDAAVLILHDFDESFHDPKLRAYASSLAAAGYPALAVALRRHDDGFLEARFHPANEGHAHEIVGAVHFLSTLGFKRVFIAGHGFGSVEAVYYRLAVWNNIPVPDRIVSGFWHFGDLPKVRDPITQFQMSPAAIQSTFDYARYLATWDIGRAYVYAGDVPVEAGSLVDYFDPDVLATHDTAARYVPRVPRNVDVAAGENDDWVGPSLTRLASAGHHGRLNESVGKDAIESSVADPFTGRVLAEVWPCADASVLDDSMVIKSSFVDIAVAGGGTITGLLSQRVNPPTSLGPARAILINHGASGKFHDFFSLTLARCLGWWGHTTLAINRRDHGLHFGRSTVDEGVADIEAAIAHIRAHNLGPGGIYLQGHSAGSFLAVRYAETDTQLNGLILTGMVTDFDSHYRSHLRASDFNRLLQDARNAVAVGIPDQTIVVNWCSEEYRDVAWCTDDELSMATRTARHVVSYAGPDGQGRPLAAAGHASMRVLIVRVEGDTLTPASEAINYLRRGSTTPTVVLEFHDGVTTRWPRPHEAHGFQRWNAVAYKTIDMWMMELNYDWIDQVSGEYRFAAIARP